MIVVTGYNIINNMKITESLIKREGAIFDLPKHKHRINFGDGNTENIWVAIDRENEVMYLFNHALGFMPLPSWGMEIPIYKSDLSSYRGETFEDSAMTVAPEAYVVLKPFINSEGIFNHEQWFEEMKAEQDKEEETGE